MILADIIGVIDRIALVRPQPWPKQQTAWRDILTSPLEFIQRLAALVLQQQLALSSDASLRSTACIGWPEWVGMVRSSRGEAVTCKARIATPAPYD